MYALDLYGYLIIVFFVMGYFLITIEHITHINKATIALLLGVICWALQFASQNSSACHNNMACFSEHIANITQVILFLLGALTIVEIINAHQGFKIISDFIEIQSKRKLLWVAGFITFFMSAVLDNLTTTIVMITLLRKLIEDREDRLLIGGGVVIAANAGGAWTPIGDVTTTMLWIGGQLSTLAIIKDLIIPSFVCMVAAFSILHFMLEGNFNMRKVQAKHSGIEPFGEFLLVLGIAVLVFVPVFKLVTGLPPFMGVLFGLGILWLVTDILHARFEERQHLRVPQVLAQVDLSGVLFFLGILLAINAMESAKILDNLAIWLNQYVGNSSVIAVLIGLASAIVDNVPLVAASMGMYDLAAFPTDDQFWQLIAFCAGTGGSILIIGSAAGVVFMGMERADFFWYIRKISLPALIGYFAGIAAYLWI